jgi:hypothetical protein
MSFAYDFILCPFLARSQNCEKRLLASCPSVRMEQLGSHRTDFEETWYLILFRKSIQKIQTSLKSNKNNGYFTWGRFDIFDDILLNSFSMRNILDKSCRENENTHFIFSNFFFENRTVYEIMSKYIVETEGPQMTSQHGAYALRTGLARLYARMRMHTPTRSGTHTHSRKHARANMHTQTSM